MIRKLSYFSSQLWLKVCLLMTMCIYAAAAAKSLQSCLTLCNPIDGSPPDSPVHGILQARTVEWVAISFSNAGKPGLVSADSIEHLYLQLKRI